MPRRIRPRFLHWLFYPPLTAATPSSKVATQAVQVTQQPTDTVALIATNTAASPDLVQTLVHDSNPIQEPTLDIAFQPSVVTLTLDPLMQANIPEKLSVGDLISVTGILTISTTNPKLAILTDKANRTIAVLVDPLTVNEANNKSVSIEGIIVKNETASMKIALQITKITVFSTNSTLAAPIQ